MTIVQCNAIKNGKSCPDSGGGEYGTRIGISPSSRPENLLANRTVDPPTMVDNSLTFGNNNFGTESAASRGFSAATNTSHASILGGLNNKITDNCDGSVIAGGQTNEIDSDGNVFIGGGGSNFVRNHGNSVLVGGGSNKLDVSSGTVDYTALVGGFLNAIWHASYGFLGGGRGNRLSNSGFGLGTAEYGVVVGGRDNVLTQGHYSVILGGQDQTIGDTTDASYAGILWGYDCRVDGADFGGAAGRQAKVTHHGAVVFADQTATDKNSDYEDQYKTAFAGGRSNENPTLTAGRRLDERLDEGSTSGDGDVHTFDVGTLDANGDVYAFVFEVTATRTNGTAGDDWFFIEGRVVASRKAGTLTVQLQTETSISGGTGSGCSVSAGNTGDVVEIDFNSPSPQPTSEDWDVLLTLTRRKVTR